MSLHVGQFTFVCRFVICVIVFVHMCLYVYACLFFLVYVCDCMYVFICCLYVCDCVYECEELFFWRSLLHKHVYHWLEFE